MWPMQSKRTAVYYNKSVDIDKFYIKNYDIYEKSISLRIIKTLLFFFFYQF